MLTYLVTYKRIITLKSNHIKVVNTHRVFIVAEDADEAINTVKKFLQIDEKTSKGIITHDDFTATFCKAGDMLLDNGTCVINGNVLHEGE